MLAAGVATKRQLVRSLLLQAAAAALVDRGAQETMVSMETGTSAMRAALAAQDLAGRLDDSKPTFRHWEPTAETAPNFLVLGLAAVAVAVVSGQTTLSQPM
jgi:hypothetical protein